MWTCPKCGRKLLKENQNHFCGQGPVTVDEYIQEQPEEIRPFLYQVRSAIKEVLPDADEIISWRMPTYKKKRNIIHFAAFKNHIGIYPGDEAILHFKERLSEYKTSKGAIRLPYTKPLPLDLIKEIALWCHETGRRH
ncbi:MAG: iron chaperone [Clostridia bacterium]|jgi:uncharacterized protein YdhG (YjbR/CyaY superfamily)|nr:hypothetical protein [Clostridiaceae bacterium]